MALKNKVTTAALSDPGLNRKNNEDAVGEESEVGLLVLADGMGGYNAGEVASGIAVKSVVDGVRDGWSGIARGKIDGETGYSNEALLLRKAIEQAHATIHQVSQSQPQCAGMGTTIVSCILHDDRASIAYVGDSRFYRMRGDTLEQITRDHTLVEELIARGHYNREDATKLVRRNIVTRALGVEPLVQVDIIEDPLAVGDILLLCSDGLTDMIDDATIALTLKQFAANLQEAAQKLIDAANANGGKDNISVVLARIDASFARGRRWYERLLEWF